jgi:hypothetical protein
VLALVFHYFAFTGADAFHLDAVNDEDKPQNFGDSVLYITDVPCGYCAKAIFRCTTAAGCTDDKQIGLGFSIKLAFLSRRIYSTI